MKYPFPIKCHDGLKPYITQFFGNTSLNAWYQANGITAPAHNAIDFTLGSDTQTYGTAFVCPFPTARVTKIWWDDPMSTKGNGLQIVFDDLTVLIWHLSGIETTKGQVSFGQTLGYLGNAGLVRPEPTPANPFAGSHGHLSVKKNGKDIDPLDVFDLNNLIVGADTGLDKDLPPLVWVVKWISAQIDKLRK